MVILDTTTVPLSPSIKLIREFYQNSPRTVQFEIVGTATVTLYGRVDSLQTFQPIVSVTTSDMFAMFLPPQVYADVSGAAGSWRVIVSTNITRTID